MAAKIWHEPETGYGEFQDLYEEFYNELVDNTIEEDSDRHDTASELAGQFTLKVIERLGYEIVES